MKNKNILIICSSMREYEKLSNLSLDAYKNVVVASNEYDVHLSCQKNSAITAVRYIDGILNYEHIADDLIAIIENINSSLNEFAKDNDLKEELVFWQMHVEGGKTSQIVQDLLVYINIWQNYIVEYAIDEIVVMSKKQTLYEKALELVANHKEIAFSYKSCSYIQSKKETKEKLKDLFRPWFRLAKTLYIRQKSKPKIELSEYKNIALLNQFSSELKHIDYNHHMLPHLKESGFTPIVFSWGIATNIDSYFSGFIYLNLEKYLSFTNFTKSIGLLLKLYLIKGKVTRYLANHKPIYNGYDLSELLLPYIEQHLLDQLPTNYNIDSAIKEMLKSKPDIKVCMLAGFTLAETKVKFDQVYKLFPIFFHTMVFGFAENKISQYEYSKSIDFYKKRFLFFTKGELYKNKITSNGIILSKNTYVVGDFESFAKKQEKKSKLEALMELGVSPEYHFTIAFDYSSSLLGLQSMEEVVGVLGLLVDFAKKHPEIALLIKPHPSADVSALEDMLVKNTSVQNIYYIPRKNLPHTVLIASDVLITKFSAIGLQGMDFDTMILSYIFDKSENLKVYGNAAKYVYSKSELKSYIEHLFSSKETFATIQEEHLQRNREFLDSYIDKSGKGFADMSRILKERISSEF